MIDKLERAVYSIGLALIILIVLTLAAKLAYDIWQVPNIFLKETPVCKEKQ